MSTDYPTIILRFKELKGGDAQLQMVLKILLRSERFQQNLLHQLRRECKLTIERRPYLLEFEERSLWEEGANIDWQTEIEDWKRVRKARKLRKQARAKLKEKLKSL